MYSLHIRLLARQDIQEIVDFYDVRAFHITNQFLEVLFSEFETIKMNPELFQKKFKNTRVRYLKGFHFGSHYILRENIVEVLAILHTSRDPENWNER